LLKEIDKLGVKSVSIPMETNVKLRTNNGEPLPNIGQYQRLVGKLIYLTIWPDIAFTISMVSQSMHALCTSHLNVID
jgi:hypothetical protein